MWCTSCGTQIQADAKFCSACGTAAGQTGFTSRRADPRPAAAEASSLKEGWAHLKAWRGSAIFAPIPDVTTARTLVVGGVAALATETTLSLLAGVLINPVFAIGGLIVAPMAAALWFANSRVAGVLALTLMGFGLMALLAAGMPGGVINFIREIVFTICVGGAMRGAFAMHDLQRAAAPPIATMRNA